MSDVAETASVAALLLGTVAGLHAFAFRGWRWPGAALLVLGLVAWGVVGEDETPVLLVLGEGTGVHAGDAAVLPALLLLGLLVLRR